MRSSTGVGAFDLDLDDRPEEERTRLVGGGVVPVDSGFSEGTGGGGVAGRGGGGQPG